MTTRIDEWMQLANEIYRLGNARGFAQHAMLEQALAAMAAFNARNPEVFEEVKRRYCETSSSDITAVVAEA